MQNSPQKFGGRFFRTALLLALLTIATLALNSTPSHISDQTDPEGSIEVDFGGIGQPYNRITAYELSVWAANRNLALIDDCPWRDLQDHEAAIIGSPGLEFEFYPRPGKFYYLYLDLVTFRPQSASLDPSDLSNCLGSTNQIYAPPTTKTTPLPGMQLLEVMVNGQTMKTIYMGNDLYPDTPVKIALDPTITQHLPLRIKLRPSSKEGYFAIWDAFLSRSPSPLPLDNNE